MQLVCMLEGARIFGVVSEAEDPDAKKKKLIELFSAIGVKPSEMVMYLGHDLDGITPAELADLRSVYMAINEGEAKWADFVKAMDSENEEATSKVSAAKAKMREKIEKQRKVAAEPADAKEAPQAQMDDAPKGNPTPALDDQFRKAFSNLKLFDDEDPARTEAIMKKHGITAFIGDIGDESDQQTKLAVIAAAAELKERA